MKAILFYLTAFAVIMTLCITDAPVLAYIGIVFADVILVVLCRKYISFRDVVRYTGYDIWYKILKP